MSIKSVISRKRAEAIKQEKGFTTDEQVIRHVQRIIPDAGPVSIVESVDEPHYIPLTPTKAFPEAVPVKCSICGATGFSSAPITELSVPSCATKESCMRGAMAEITRMRGH